MKDSQTSEGISNQQALKKPENKNSFINTKYFSMPCQILVIIVSCFFYFVLIDDGDQDNSHDLHSDDFTIQKSKLDEKIYKYVELPNKIKFILVSDPSSQTSAVSLNLNLGSYNDPEEMPGLAHYIEHMLFINSYTYPEANGFMKFVDENSGTTNAFTSVENTNYFFSIPCNHFEKALDMFSHFFIDPQFDPEYLDREVNAIESEFQLSFQSESFRQFHATQIIVEPGTKYKKFMCGNLDSLKHNPVKNGINIEQAVRKHYHSRYSSNMMLGSIISNHKIDEMERMVNTYFGKIENKELENEQINLENVWQPLPKILAYNQVKSNHILGLVFGLNSTLNLIYVNPLEFLEYNLKYTGDNSFKGTLLENGWLKDFSIEMMGHTSIYKDFFMIEFKLTEEGVDHVYEIIEYFYAYLDLLLSKGINEERYQEIENIKRISFDYSLSDVDQSEIAVNLALAIKVFPPSKALSAGNLLFKFDKEELEKFIIETLDMKNMLILVSSSKMKYMDVQDPIKLDLSKKKLIVTALNKRDEFFKIDYSYLDLPDKFKESIINAAKNYDFKLSPPNRFIPRNFDLLGPVVDEIDSSLIPTRVLYTENYELWHSQFSLKKYPSAILQTRFIDNLQCNSSSDRFQLLVLAQRLKKVITKLSSEPTLADYKVEFSFDHFYYELYISGIGDKMLEIWEYIMDYIKRDNITKEDYLQAKRSAADWIENYKKDYLNRFARNEIRRSLRGCWFDINEYANISSTLIYEEYLNFHNHWLKDFFIKILITGNLDLNKSKKKVYLLMKRLGNRGTNTPKKSLRVFGKSLVYRSKSPFKDSNEQAICNFYMAEGRDPKTSAELDIIESIFATYMFDEIRTKRSLGYIVSARKDPYFNSLSNGYIIIVQGPATNPMELDVVIEEAIKAFQKILLDLSNEKIETIKEGIREERRESSKKLEGTSKRWMNEIGLVSIEPNFELQSLRALSSITKEDLLETYFIIFRLGKISHQVFKLEDSEMLPTTVLNYSQQYSQMDQVLINSLNL